MILIQIVQRDSIIYGEIIFHEILQYILEQRIMIDGDDREIYDQTTIQEIQEAKDSDHVQMDIMYLVHENGEP